MTQEEKLKIEEKIVEYLRTVVDPEIAVDIYSLGLVYKIDLADDGALNIDMTLTAPNCPWPTSSWKMSIKNEQHKGCDFGKRESRL